MSQYIPGLLCSLILVGYSTSAVALNNFSKTDTIKNIDSTGQNGQTKKPDEPAGADQVSNLPNPGQNPACPGAANSALEACQTYLDEDLESTINSKSSDNLPQDIKSANAEMRVAIIRSWRGKYNCVKQADACGASCQSHPVRLQCTQKKIHAEEKHRHFKKRAENAIADNQKLLKTIAADDPTAEPSLGGAGGGGLAGGITAATPEIPSQQITPQSVPAQSAPVQAPPVEKTAEQQKEERREKRAEERRQERIDVLGKAFMSLNQQQPLGQALQEKTAATPEQQAAASAAAKAAAKNAPQANEKDEDDIGRAGFNAMAKKNLQARKALAAAMGLNADNLRGATIQPIPNGSSGSAGGGIGADGRFEGFSGGGATLDPVVETQRPSDLPQNFKLGAPSAGGGGGNDSAANQGAQPQKRAPARQFAGRGDDDHAPARGPAGLSPASVEIRTQAADIWMVMSTAFHKRCAAGRLMDCAEHLPK
jgi:hypothetical protein